MLQRSRLNFRYFLHVHQLDIVRLQSLLCYQCDRNFESLCCFPREGNVHFLDMAPRPSRSSKAGSPAPAASATPARAPRKSRGATPSQPTRPALPLEHANALLIGNKTKVYPVKEQTLNLATERVLIKRQKVRLRCFHAVCFQPGSRVLSRLQVPTPKGISGELARSHSIREVAELFLFF